MSADLRAVLAEALKSVNVLLDGVVVSFSSTADLGLLADALAEALRGKVVVVGEAGDDAALLVKRLARLVAAVQSHQNVSDAYNELWSHLCVDANGFPVFVTKLNESFAESIECALRERLLAPPPGAEG